MNSGMPLTRLALLVALLISGVAVTVDAYVESRRPLLTAPSSTGSVSDSGAMERNPGGHPVDGVDSNGDSLVDPS